MLNTGGCFCGAIRYEFDGEDHLVANCHCTMCRKTSAAPYVTWVIVPASDFRYTQGTPKMLQSSEKGKRYFCAECGTPVACIIGEQSTEVDVTVGSLDKPAEFKPTIDVHEDNRLPWVK